MSAWVSPWGEKEFSNKADRDWSSNDVGSKALRWRERDERPNHNGEDKSPGWQTTGKEMTTHLLYPVFIIAEILSDCCLGADIDCVTGSEAGSLKPPASCTIRGAIALTLPSARQTGSHQRVAEAAEVVCCLQLSPFPF